MLHSELILPGSLAWKLALENLPPPPGWRQEADRTGGEMALIGLPGQHGLLQVVPMARYWEYVHDGEADLRQEEIEEQEGVIWI